VFAAQIGHGYAGAAATGVVKVRIACPEGTSRGTFIVSM